MEEQNVVINLEDIKQSDNRPVPGTKRRLFDLHLRRHIIIKSKEPWADVRKWLAQWEIKFHEVHEAGPSMEPKKKAEAKDAKPKVTTWSNVKEFPKHVAVKEIEAPKEKRKRGRPKKVQENHATV